MQGGKSRNQHILLWRL